MKTTIVTILCLSILAMNVAYADKEAGTYAPDIEAKDWMNTEKDEPISIMELRGMVVVLFLWVSYHPGGEYMMPLMSQVDNSRFGRQSGVYLIGLTDSDRERVGEMIEKEKVFFPVGMESESFEEYDISSFPRVVIIDPGGKIAWSGWPGKDGGQKLIEEISRVAAETPPTRTHPAEAKLVHQYLKQARRALREDAYRDGFQSARRAFEHALTGDALKTRCQDMLDLIEALGRARLAEAERALDEKNFEQAVTYLREVKLVFKGVDIAQTANRRLKAMKKKYTEVTRILEELEDAAHAENLLARAMEELRARKIGVAYEHLEEILDEYGSTDTAEKARTVIDRMKRNDAVMGYVRDHKAASTCRTLMSQAKAYERTDRTDKAKQIYHKIIEDHPDTIYADEAAMRLAQLL